MRCVYLSWECTPFKQQVKSYLFGALYDKPLKVQGVQNRWTFFFNVPYYRSKLKSWV